MSTATGTATSSIALNSQNTLPANKIPMASEIFRARGVSATGRAPTNSHPASSGRPMKPRNKVMVSASALACSVSLVSTSAQPKAVAAMIAGASCARRLPAWTLSG